MNYYIVTAEVDDYSLLQKGEEFFYKIIQASSWERAEDKMVDYFENNNIINYYCITPTIIKDVSDLENPFSEVIK